MTFRAENRGLRPGALPGSQHLPQGGSTGVAGFPPPQADSCSPRTSGVLRVGNPDFLVNSTGFVPGKHLGQLMANEM